MTQMSRLLGVRIIGMALAAAVVPVYGQAEAPAPAGGGTPFAVPAPAPESPAPAPSTTPSVAPAPDAAAPATAPADAAPGTGAAAPAAAAPAAETPAAGAPEQTLMQNVDNFWHYAAIARYDLANSQLTPLLSRDPKELLQGFEAEAKDRDTDLDLFLLKAQNIPALKDSITLLKQKLEAARADRRAQPGYIEENIKKLSEGERAYANALSRLRQSGELAVPAMLDILRDNHQEQYHAGVRRALRDMGRQVLNPLVAATEMRGNPQALVALSDILSEIPFADVVPYLARIVQDKDTSPVLRSAVSEALGRLNVNPQSINAGDLFYQEAERFYYGTAGIQYDSRNPVAYYWYWDNDRNMLVHKDVPPAVFNDVMAMRCAEMALKLNSDKDAASLWLAADNKRETDLKPGEKSGVFDDAPAHFWNVRLGTRYSNNVLARALHDQNTAVALKVIKSLQEIVGQSNLLNNVASSPLLDAMRYGDRLVRFEAAIAIGSALPDKPFAGQERVVLLLGEAVAQTGTGGVLVLAPNEQVREQLKTDIGKQFTTVAATTAAAAIADSATLPSIDAIVITDQDSADQLRQFFEMAANNPRMERAARLVITQSKSSPWYRQALVDKLLTATQASAGESLIQAIDAARVKAAGAPLDAKTAAEYSVRAANLLGRLAVARGQVLDISTAEPVLLGALGDNRPDTVKAVAMVLAQLDSRNTQPALLDKALAQKTGDDVRVSLYKALAQSAKLYGNRLDASRIDQLRQAIQSTQASPDIRNAAAEAGGALSLPVEQIKNLILNRAGAPGVSGPVSGT